MNATLVACAVIKYEGKYLLVQQARSRRQAGKWGLPGGKPEHTLGESLMEAAIRETKEETGLTVDITGFAGIIRSGHKSEPNLFICFIGNLKSSVEDLKLMEGEIKAARWMSIEEIESGVVPLRAVPLVTLIRQVNDGKWYPLDAVLHEAIDPA